MEDKTNEELFDYGKKGQFSIDFDKIGKNSQGFALDRIYKVDLAILTVEIYEILFRDDIPYSVSANEATELAKKYSTDKSYAFVNGILASVIKEIGTK